MDLSRLIPSWRVATTMMIDGVRSQNNPYINIIESYIPPFLQDTCRWLQQRQPRHLLWMQLMVPAFPRRRHREPGRSWPGKTYSDMMWSCAFHLWKLIIHFGIMIWTAWITFDEPLYHSTRSVFVKRRNSEFDEWWWSTRGLISMFHSLLSTNGNPRIKTRWPTYSWRRTGTRRTLGMVGI